MNNIQKVVDLLEEAKDLSVCSNEKCPCCLDWLEVVDQALAMLKEPCKACGGTDTREKLAKLCHEQWSGWMEYLFNKCVLYKPGNVQAEEGAMIIPKWAVERWLRQSLTPYIHLSSKEQDSDLAEADRFIRLLNIDCQSQKPVCATCGGSRKRKTALNGTVDIRWMNEPCPACTSQEPMKNPCKHAKSDMTPCYLRDDENALTVDGLCAGPEYLNRQEPDHIVESDKKAEPVSEFVEKNRYRIKRDTLLLLLGLGASSKAGLRVIAREALKHLSQACDRLEAETKRADEAEIGAKVELAFSNILDKCRESFKQLQEKLVEQERIGYEKGLEAYAWWKDGVQYVGTCGTTLRQALKGQ